jgi:hypothetical protein
MGLKNNVTVQEVIALLNEFLELDPEAIQNLINNRCKCNDKVANHPTIQVRKYPEDEDYTVGLLGILNNLFGIREDGMGAICAEIEDISGKIITFKETPPLNK